MRRFHGRKSGSACEKSSEPGDKRQGLKSLASQISKTQIDKLGDRLKEGNITEADLRLLDEYRRSFAEVYETVVGMIRNDLALEPTGRPAKSTTSISDKLRRERIRLTQIQDIAGCRLVVADIQTQDDVVRSLNNLFDQVSTVDRRKQPSHGYRAVHVIVKHAGTMVEIQVRSALQHLWAEISEKLSDVVDPKIKYGGGDPSAMKLLLKASEIVTTDETNESKLADLEQKVSRFLSMENLGQDKQQELINLQRQIKDAKMKLITVRERDSKILQNALEELSNLR